MTDEEQRLRGRRPALEARARVLSEIRRWFEGEGFLEVDTPARVRVPGQEVHLDAIASEERWLVTSPEYAMKRLCGAGYERIVSIGKCWRAEERGPHHDSEFTMIEWYRAGAPLERIAIDCEELVRLAARAAKPRGDGDGEEDKGKGKGKGKGRGTGTGPGMRAGARTLRRSRAGTRRSGAVRCAS